MRTIDASQGIRILDSRTTASLLSKVLWITTAGFLFTAFGAYIAPDVLPGMGFFAVVLINFGLIFGIRAATRRSTGLGLALFYLFTVLMGVEIGPLLKAYLHMAGGQTVVFEAALTTAMGMAVMAMIAQIARFDYRKLASFAFAALIGLVIIGFLSAFLHFISPGVYAWLGLVIFSVLLLVDFMRLRDSPAGTTPVMLALSIYLDALNIFIFLLQIFGNGGGRRDNRWS
ncbi:Bax inhibitor-1 family protein [Granulicella mallensis]|uniref:Modulator of FtsH protease n=1 Tax=Granulicella mallensis TaxID=940614 RepID=A0A7W7ZNP1_9BACT|nr:Bax inhibitor-1 family protein [Granulicella mallensis]MBB5063351.1 modulator of FtsH protease [Granulicella mallensis]